MRENDRGLETFVAVQRLCLRLVATTPLGSFVGSVTAGIVADDDELPDAEDELDGEGVNG